MRARPVRLLLVCLAMLGSTIGLTNAAAAGAVSSTSATVSSGKLFQPWGDNRTFEPLPAGTGETAMRVVGNRWEGWEFTNAGFTAGGTPWNVWGTTNSSIVRLSSKGSMASLYSWSDHVEDIRFFYNAPHRGALLDVRVLSWDPRTRRQGWLDYRLSAPAAGWNVSPALRIDALGSTTDTRQLQITFWSLGGTFLIDDVSIDPWVSKPR